MELHIRKVALQARRSMQSAIGRARRDLGVLAGDGALAFCSLRFVTDLCKDWN
jgi:hypothetical protein